jgi:SAM-dependent methyltransferase
VGSRPGFQLRGSAPERYERYLRPIMAPFVAALIEAGRLQPGSAVLDVACGTGFVARAAAARVGPTGRIAGTDLNPGMLDVAAARSRDVRPEIQWRAAPADRLPFPGRELRRAALPAGIPVLPGPRRGRGRGGAGDPPGRPGRRHRVAAARPVTVHAGAAALDRDGRGTAGRRDVQRGLRVLGRAAHRAFRAAGLGQVESREVLADVRLPSIAEFVPGHLSAIPWAAALAEAHPDGMRLAADAMLDELAAHTEPDGSLVVPFAALLVAGTR